MSFVGRWTARTLLGAALAVLLHASPTRAEDVPFVAGEMWLETAPILKRTFLVGVSNLMGIEYAYQKDNGFPERGKSTIRRLYEEIDDVTLEEAISRIDGWYEKNPGKMDTTVLEVIWIDMVEPNLPADRRS